MILEQGRNSLIDDLTIDFSQIAVQADLKLNDIKKTKDKVVKQSFFQTLPVTEDHSTPFFISNHNQDGGMKSKQKQRLNIFGIGEKKPSRRDTIVLDPIRSEEDSNISTHYDSGRNAAFLAPVKKFQCPLPKV